jgi:hypothetical protein
MANRSATRATMRIAASWIDGIPCVAWTFVILAITCLPLDNFVGHAHWEMIRWIPFYDEAITSLDSVANTALFMPFGYLLLQALSSARSNMRHYGSSCLPPQLPEASSFTKCIVITESPRRRTS